MIKAILTTTALALFFIPTAANASPFVALSVKDINSNISCRVNARSKFLQFGATGLSEISDNSQWAEINGMTANVWCRGNQASITVAGSDRTAVMELRDELNKIF